MAEEITAPEEQGTEPEKTFTQAEVDKIIEGRIARERKGMPSAEELEKYRSWQKEHESDAEKLGSMTKERDEANKALETARNENTLLKMGVPADDVDYYAFKIGQLVTDKKDFETAAKEFFKEKKPRKTVIAEMGAESGGSNGKSVNEKMNDIIRNARK